MPRDSSARTIFVAALVCLVCSVVVSSSAVLLRERQELNRRIDREGKIVLAAGLADPESKLSIEQVEDLFQKVKVRLINLETGQFVNDMKPEMFDLEVALTSEKLSRPAPQNLSRIQRLPQMMKIYMVEDEDGREKLILPIWGYGLWGVLHGYIVIFDDTTTISGVTYYDHKETPGLGGEVDNPWWKSLWNGRRIYNEEWAPVFSLKKPPVGKPDQDPYHVDALSGATITSNGVTNMIQFWFSEEGYGPFLSMYRQKERD